MNDVSGGSVGTSYTLKIPACAINCKVNKLPVAKAHDVTVAAASTGGTGNASIDNGSFDPDGDPLTLTQSPPGPYSLGVTNVLLSVSDPVGATSQASGKVTVVNPEFSLALTLSSVTVTAGQSGTEHVTFTPNPGIGAPLNFACSGLPTESSCLFSPNPVPPNSPQTDVVLTITTTAPSAALGRPRTFYAAWLPVSGLGLLGMIVMAAPRQRRRTAILMTVLFISVLMLLIGCGGGSSRIIDPGTQKGTFTVTVTGTSGSLSHSGTFSLTVQ